MRRGQFEVRPGQYPTGYMGVFGQYVRAEDYLYKAMEQTSFSADHCSYPILYLMRHAIEIGLKANIQCIIQELQLTPNRGLLGSHNLDKLHVSFVALVVEQNLLDVETLAYFKVECASLKELIKLMPSASSFRYTEDQQGAKVFDAQVLDLAVMKPTFDRACTLLANTPAVLFGP